MNKLIVVHFFADGKGGAFRSALDLANLTKEEIENIFIFIEEDLDFDIEFKTFFLAKKRKFYKKLDILGDVILAYKLNKLLKKINADIVISHVEAAAKILRYLNIPKIYYIRTDIMEELKQLKNKSLFRYYKRLYLYKKIFNNQVLFCISDELKNKIPFTDKKITLYNPFDKEKIIKLANEYKIKDANYILYVGSKKRSDVLLKAFAKINSNLKLILIGLSENDKNELMKLAEKLHIENKIIIKSFIKNPYPYIKNAKLLVLSSEREGLPRVLVEALILKTPIVSTNCQTGPKEILIDELSKFLASVNDPNDLAEKIKLALNNYPQISEKYIAKFDKFIIKKKYLETLKEVL
jgi:glycosyltransferase involved in cell wall biosynthesis